MSTSKETKNARRERLAAERAAQAAKEARQRRLVTIVGIVAVVAVVVGVGVAVQASRNDTTDAALPATVTAPGDPVVRNPGLSAVPVLDYWEDFQCPACKQAEDATGDALRTLVEQGKVTVRYHMLHFLDGNLRNDSSQRSANAFACSADAGKQGAYHDIIFANQPTTEGVGYTDDQLLQWAQDVGITGAAFDTFTDCFASDKYGDYVTSVATAGAQQGINSTPTVFLDGAKLDFKTQLMDPAAFTKAVTDAAAG
jgi:protein-disulfide isomerase